MLAEKFILLLEALQRSARYPDGSAGAASTSPHVPAQLPHRSDGRGRLSGLFFKWVLSGGEPDD